MEQINEKPGQFNEKDLNNVIAMLQAENVGQCFKDMAWG